jgi:hypothetical protein
MPSVRSAIITIESSFLADVVRRAFGQTPRQYSLSKSTNAQFLKRKFSLVMPAVSVFWRAR